MTDHYQIFRTKNCNTGTELQDIKPVRAASAVQYRPSQVYINPDFILHVLERYLIRM
jgi:hypothetical protein